jgi:hypothetical protein
LPFGFFNAYGNPARKDSVDYVVHLGDYIYEYKNGDYGWGNSIGRIPEPDHELFTLYDYRRRLAQYRTDLDLLLSVSNFPEHFISLSGYFASFNASLVVSERPRHSKIGIGAREGLINFLLEQY